MKIYTYIQYKYSALRTYEMSFSNMKYEHIWIAKKDSRRSQRYWRVRPKNNLLKKIYTLEILSFDYLEIGSILYYNARSRALKRVEYSDVACHFQ